MSKKGISSFDLELNPFEQSFASTKKASIVPGPAQAGKQQMQAQAQAQPLPFHHGVAKISPLTTQPPVISPGGMKKLPALLLSPGMMAQSQSAFASTLNNTNKTTPLGTVRTPSFYINSGLTPNESSLRTGLTPLVQGVPTLLPMMGANGTSANRTNASFTPGLTTLLGYSAMQPSPNSMAMLGGNVAFPPPQLNGMLLRGAPQINGTSTSKIIDNGTNEVRTLSEPMEDPSTTLGASSNISSVNATVKKVKKPKLNNKKTKTIKSKKATKSKAHEESDESAKKRKEFLERNRLAASKFRQRKKEYIKKIEDDLDSYKKEYTELTGIVDQLMGYDQQTSIIADLEKAINSKDSAKALDIVNSIKILIFNSGYLKRARKPLHGEEDVEVKSEYDSDNDNDNNNEKTNKKENNEDDGDDNDDNEGSNSNGIP